MTPRVFRCPRCGLEQVFTACRSEYRAAIDDAGLQLSRSNAQSLTIITNGLAGLAEGDQSKVQAAIDLAPAIETAKATALDTLEEANEKYSEAVELSREDPSAFLAQCNS